MRGNSSVPRRGGGGRFYGRRMTDSVRAEIARSWQRSRSAGLEPAGTIEEAGVRDVDRRSRLLAAANPILDRMASVLSRTGYCVILADRDARLVDIRSGTTRVRDVVAGVGAVIGRPFTERTSGTNSIATVYETRTPLAVRGDEHYMENMKRFSCYGYPLLHPATQRLEGVLDITFLESDDNPLLGPMLSYAARDIQDRLMEATHTGEQMLFAEFQRVSARRRGAPVVALAEEMRLENAAAGLRLSEADHRTLWAATDGTVSRSGTIARLELSSGVYATVHWTRPEGGTGIVVEIDPVEDGTRRLTALDRVMRDAIIGELDRHDGNKRTASETLGISRTTLYKRMRRLGIPG